MCPFNLWYCSQELLPRGLDIKQEELGDLVDKEMATTSAAIEAATTRIEVRGLCRISHSNTPVSSLGQHCALGVS